MLATAPPPPPSSYSYRVVNCDSGASAAPFYPMCCGNLLAPYSHAPQSRYRYRAVSCDIDVIGAFLPNTVSQLTALYLYLLWGAWL